MRCASPWRRWQRRGATSSSRRRRIEGYRNFGTKLWNAARFLAMQDCRRDPDFDPAAVKLTVNRWIPGEVGRANREVTEGIASHRYNDAAGALYQFVWNVFCDWYIELIKPVLGGSDATAAAETRKVARLGPRSDPHPAPPVHAVHDRGAVGQDRCRGPARETMLIDARWPSHGRARRCGGGRLRSTG